MILEEAAAKDLVIAFVGQPHRLNGQKAQVRKALTEIGWQDYMTAEQTGWILYLEGSTDLHILRAFADRLKHTKAAEALRRPFVKYVGNDTGFVLRHFHGLQEAVPKLAGLALFDRIEQNRPNNGAVQGIAQGIAQEIAWRKREIENYLCTKRTLEAWVRETAAHASLGPLFTEQAQLKRLAVMRESIEIVEQGLRTFAKPSAWDAMVKASDDVLEPVFRTYHAQIGEYNSMSKRHFHQLVQYIPDDDIDPEITEKLDAIAAVAESADAPGLP